MLADIFQEVARRIDGAVLVREALAHAGLPPGGPFHVLAVGKVAFPMLEGFFTHAGPQALTSGLLVAPGTRFPETPRLAAGLRALIADHPDPTSRSLLAAQAAREFVARLSPVDRLVVLLSGGGSALLCAPAPDVTFEDKRATVAAVARGGATIAELNAVRKHLSAVKGGQLALATAASVTVLALSDVVGNDPGTIASGPFSPDATTFVEALAHVDRLAPQAAGLARAHLRRGVAGDVPETPKPGDGRLARVAYRVVAGPERVAEEARRAVLAAGRIPGVLSIDTEADVHALAEAYVERAQREAAAGGKSLVLVGNGEPRIVVQGAGRGGRATHLALLVARGIAGLAGVSFLAAGTDDRDGNTEASGAIVDGDTWQRTVAIGLDPQGALDRCDSAQPLGAMGALVRGPGTSNLLDLHLMSIGQGTLTGSL